MPTASMFEEKNGLHWAEDHMLVEVLDPDTVEQVADGERGELVLTTLKKTARPMIRFCTGDIVSFTSEPCAYGRTSIRIAGEYRLIVERENHLDQLTVEEERAAAYCGPRRRPRHPFRPAAEIHHRRQCPS